jgi:hypothetical protein
MAKVSAGGGPAKYQTINVLIAMPITVGTK